MWQECRPTNPPMASLTEYITHLLAQSQATFQHLGFWGVLLFGAGIVVINAAILPLSPVALASGAIFGFWGGLLAITLGTNIGGAVNFLIARYVARDTIARRLGHNERFRLIDAAVGREGWKIIVLLRLCPLPYGLSSYCYGLTAIRFWPYFFATFITIIPANCLFVWFGTTTRAFAGEGAHAHHPGEKALMVIGLIAGFCALSYITRLAKAAVEKVEREAAPPVAPQPVEIP